MTLSLKGAIIMEALVCDICGGKLTMGAGGIATCESCGMQYNSERIKEKVQEIRGTVQIDRSNQTSSFLQMAKSARKAGNNLEAEAYSNKVIEIDPSNYEAWLIKGQAAAWQSTLANPRIKEGVQFIAKGINYAPNTLKESLLTAAENDISDILTAMNKLRSERFEKWPDADEAKGWMDELLGFSQTILLFAELTHYIIDKGRVLNPIAKSVEQTVISTWNRCQNEYFPPNCAFANYPDKNRWETFIERSNNCILMMECAAAFDENYDDLLHIYENAITMREYTKDSMYWDFKYMYVGQQWVKCPDNNFVLAEQGKSAHARKISEYRQKIDGINGKKAAQKKEEARKKTEAYWNAHVEERRKLEEERDSLNGEINLKRKEIEKIPGKDDVANIQKKIDNLRQQKAALSVFKAKEKKAIQAEIDNESARKKTIQDRMDATKQVIEKEIEPLERRIKEIQNELSRER